MTGTVYTIHRREAVDLLQSMLRRSLMGLTFAMVTSLVGGQA